MPPTINELALLGATSRHKIAVVYHAFYLVVMIFVQRLRETNKKEEADGSGGSDQLVSDEVAAYNFRDGMQAVVGLREMVYWIHKRESLMQVVKSFVSAAVNRDEMTRDATTPIVVGIFGMACTSVLEDDPSDTAAELLARQLLALATQTSVRVDAVKRFPRLAADVLDGLRRKCLARQEQADATGNRVADVTDISYAYPTNCAAKRKKDDTLLVNDIRCVAVEFFKITTFDLAADVAIVALSNAVHGTADQALTLEQRQTATELLSPRFDLGEALKLHIFEMECLFASSATLSKSQMTDFANSIGACINKCIESVRSDVTDLEAATKKMVSDLEAAMKKMWSELRVDAATERRRNDKLRAQLRAEMELAQNKALAQMKSELAAVRAELRATRSVTDDADDVGSAELAAVRTELEAARAKARAELAAVRTELEAARAKARAEVAAVRTELEAAHAKARAEMEAQLRAEMGAACAEMRADMRAQLDAVRGGMRADLGSVITTCEQHALVLGSHAMRIENLGQGVAAVTSMHTAATQTIQQDLAMMNIELSDELAQLAHQQRKLDELVQQQAPPPQQQSPPPQQQSPQQQSPQQQQYQPYVSVWVPYHLVAHVLGQVSA